MYPSQMALQAGFRGDMGAIFGTKNPIELPLRILSIVLPDMRHCKVLQSVNLHDGIFWFPEWIPFPHGLCNLNGWGSTILWDRATLEEHFLNCALHISFLN